MNKEEHANDDGTMPASLVETSNTTVTYEPLEENIATWNFGAGKGDCDDKTTTLDGGGKEYARTVLLLVLEDDNET